MHRHMKLSLLAAAIGAMMTPAWAHTQDGADSGGTGELMAGPEAAAGIPVLTGPAVTTISPTGGNFMMASTRGIFPGSGC